MPKPRSASPTRLRAIALFLGVAVAASGLLLASACGPVKWSGSSTNASSTTPVTQGIAPALAGKVMPSPSGAYIGIYQPPAPFDISGLDAYAALSDKPPAVVMWYQAWAPDAPHDFDPAAAVAIYERGAVPMVTWEPWNPGKRPDLLKDPSNQPEFRLSKIINGSYDKYIRSFAQDVKLARGPVMIRFMHEMNGNWYPWAGTANGNTPAQYVLAWRHVHDLFAQEGATNVTWVWGINHESVPADPSNQYSVYYPGDKYVDWVSISGFNWGTSTPSSAWHTLDFWYVKPMAYLKSLGKPVIISEFASVENGGNKATWITDAYARFRTEYPQVRAVVYYNKRDGDGSYVRDWRIDTSVASVRAFRNAVASPYYLAAPDATLAAWMRTLTPANWAYLRSLTPVY